MLSGTGQEVTVQKLGLLLGVSAQGLTPERDRWLKATRR